MAAAPGGKTSYIAQMMKNQGVLIANDSKKERLTVRFTPYSSDFKPLHFNLQRLGVSNCTVVNYDGRKLPQYIKGFDRILLDAPCTGLGVISRDPSIKSNRFMIDVRKNAHLQRELLRAAVDCCKPGGIIVYSTCSISVEENEAVVDYITKIRHVKIRDTGLPIEKEGLTKYKEHRFNPKIALTRRVYPHVHNMDGFFIAKLQKIKDGERNPIDGTEVSKPVVKAKEAKPQKENGKKKEKKHVPAADSEPKEQPEAQLSRKEKNKLATNLKKREPQKLQDPEEKSAVSKTQEQPQQVAQSDIDVEKKKKLLLLKKKKLEQLKKKE